MQKGWDVVSHYRCLFLSSSVINLFVSRGLTVIHPLTCPGSAACQPLRLECQQELKELHLIATGRQPDVEQMAPAGRQVNNTVTRAWEVLGALLKMFIKRPPLEHSRREASP